MDFLGKYTEYYIIGIFALSIIGYLFKILGIIIPGKDIFEKLAPVIFKLIDKIKGFFKLFNGGGKK